jgi:hypothetical protein
MTGLDDMLMYYPLILTSNQSVILITFKSWMDEGQDMQSHATRMWYSTLYVKSIEMEGWNGLRKILLQRRHW